MDVDDPVLEGLEETGCDHAHEPGHDNHAGVVNTGVVNLPDHGLVKLLAGLEIGMEKHLVGDAVLPGAFDPVGPGLVGDDDPYFSVKRAAFYTIYDGLQIGISGELSR